MARAGTEEERAVDPEVLRAYRARSTTRRMRLARATFSEALVVVDLAAVAMVASSLHGVVRELVGLVFCLAVPGWSIVGLLTLHRAPLEAALTVAAGLAALVVIAQLAVTFDLWHLTALELVVCVACLPSLLWQSLDRRRLRATAT